MRNDWRTYDTNSRNFLISVAMVVPRVFVGILSIPIARHFIGNGPWSAGDHVSWTSQLSPWDASLYISIARSGYSTTNLHAFYPVYPLLIKLFSLPFGYTASSLAVTWIAAIFAVWGVIDVTKRFTNIQFAWWAGLLLVWNPLSVFFISGYPESLLVAAMIWSLRFCLEARWGLAALLAAVSSCVLPQGVASGAVVLLAIVLSDRTSRGVVRGLGFGVLGELGIVSYWIYCWQTTGNPFIATRAAQLGWGTHLSYPFHAVFEEWSQIFAHHGLGGIRFAYVLDVVTAVVVVALTVIAFKMCRQRQDLLLPASLLSLSLLISILAWNAGFISTARYLFFLAPLYTVIAYLVYRRNVEIRVHIALDLALISAFLAMTFGLMINFGWVG
jgi:hypothetical protein